MTDTKCVDCGKELSASAQERGFKRCYDCYMKSRIRDTAPVKTGATLSLAQEHAKSEVKSPKNKENDSTNLAVKPQLLGETNARADSTNLDDDRRLAEMNMKYGCAWVYRFRGRFFGWGDYYHHPAENINQNLKMLVKMLQNNPSLSYAGKDFDSDTYQGKEKIELALIKNKVERIYEEKLFELNPDGGIIGEAIV